jgi:hypothetical protein
LTTKTYGNTNPGRVANLTVQMEFYLLFIFWTI